MITDCYKLTGVTENGELLLEKMSPAEAEAMFKPENRIYLGPIAGTTEPKQETWRDRPPLL